MWYDLHGASPGESAVGDPQTEGESVYLYTQLGWQPLVDSYLTSIPDAVRERNRDLFSKLMEENCSLVQGLVGWLVQPALDFIRHDCRLFVTTSALHRVHCLLQLYSCLLDEFIDGMDSVPQSQVVVTILVSFRTDSGCVAESGVASLSLPLLSRLVSRRSSRWRLPDKI